MNNSNITIREYKQGDELGIINLYNEVFNKNRTLEYWNWKFKENKQGQAFIFLAESNKEIIACESMIRCHLNFMGCEIPALQTCDVMVRADQRRKGLFTKVAIKKHEAAVDNGIKAVLGFPNQDSFPGFIRNFDWDRIAQLKQYKYRIGFRDKLGRHLDYVYKFMHKKSRLRYIKSGLKNIRLRLMKRDFEVVVLSWIPEDLDEFLKEARECEVLSVFKDVSYLKWRYENNPDKNYFFHILYNKSRPEGLIVVKDCGSMIEICDLIHRTKDVSQSAFLLTHVQRYYHMSKAQLIQFYGHDNTFFDMVFSACGFSILPSSFVIFAGRVFDDKKLEKYFIYPYNWTIAIGDSDLI